MWCGGLPQGLMMNNTKGEQPREGCSCGGDASWDNDEQYKGKNSLLRLGVLVLGELVAVRISP